MVFNYRDEKKRFLYHNAYYTIMLPLKLCFYCLILLCAKLRWETKHYCLFNHLDFESTDHSYPSATQIDAKILKTKGKKRKEKKKKKKKERE